MVKIFYLRDTFEASELDTDKWSQTNGVVQLGGAARMPLGNTYSTLESVRSYELRQSEVVSHITAFGAGETRELTMSCRIDASNEVSFYLKNSTLTFRLRVGGVDNDTSIAFDRAGMAHWKLFEREGIIQWMTSTDGRSWSLRRTAVHGLDLSSVTLRYSAGYYGTLGAGTLGGGTYGAGLYGGVSGVAPDEVAVESVNLTNQPAGVPSTVPPVVSPLPAPAWQWAIGNWRDDAPSNQLTMAGSRSLHLHLRSPSEARFVTWGYADETRFLEELISDLWVTRNGEVLFRGRLDRADDSLDIDSYSIDCNAVDYRGLLERRLLQTDFSPSNVEQSTTVWDLISHTQSQTGGSLGLTQDPAWPTTGVLRTASFKTGDSVWDSIQKYALMSNGFDLTIDEHKVVSLHNPKFGEANGEVLDYGGIVTRARRIFDPARYANVIRQSGSSEPVTTPSVQAVPDLATAPEGRWEAQFGDTDLRTNDAVTQTAIAKLAETSRLLPSYQVTLARGAWRGPGHLWLGDEAIVVVKAGRLFDVLTLRIYDMDIDVDVNGHETVTITLGDPKIDLRAYLRGISKRVQTLQKR